MLLWDKFLSQLELELGHATVLHWLRTLRLVRFDAANISLEARDSFQTSWFEEHVRPLCARLVNHNNRPIHIHLSSPTSPHKERHVSHGSSMQEARVLKSECSSIAPDSLDPEMKLENFLPHSSHPIASNLISEIHKTAFNPIFLYGPSGSGKTHLLMAAAAILKAKGSKVFYVRATSFTEHVVQAIRKSFLVELRSAYRSIDALLVDDIHIFSRKAATQEEFFHTFNELHTRGCPILLSSQCHPSKLHEIEPRLVSRFEWGITIPLEKGNWEKILAKKAELWNLNLKPDLIPFLIETFPSSPLLPLQALVLRANTSFPLDAKLASDLLKDLLEYEAIHTWTAEKIVKTVAANYGIRAADILGKSQTREFAIPRHVAMYICREKLKLPFQKIGNFFGRDHSTVITSVRQVGKEIEKKNPDVCAAITCLNCTRG